MTIRRVLWIALCGAILFTLSPIAAVLTFGAICYIIGGRRSNGTRHHHHRR